MVTGGLEIVGPDDELREDTDAVFIVEVDSSRRPTAVRARSGGRREFLPRGLVPSDDIVTMGDEGPVTISVYETDACIVVEINDTIGVIPASTRLYHEVRGDLSQVSRHLTSNHIIYPSDVRLRPLVCRECGTKNWVVAWAPPMECVRKPPPPKHDVLL